MQWTIQGVKRDDKKPWKKRVLLTLSSGEKGTKKIRVSVEALIKLEDYLLVQPREEIVGKTFEAPCDDAKCALNHYLIRKVNPNIDEDKKVTGDNNYHWEIYEVTLKIDGGFVYVGTSSSLKSCKRIEITTDGLKQLMEHFRVKNIAKLVGKIFISGRDDAYDAFNEFMLLMHKPPLIVKSKTLEVHEMPARPREHSEFSDF